MKYVNGPGVAGWALDFDSQNLQQNCEKLFRLNHGCLAMRKNIMMFLVVNGADRIGSGFVVRTY